MSKSPFDIVKADLPPTTAALAVVVEEVQPSCTLPSADDVIYDDVHPFFDIQNQGNF